MIEDRADDWGPLSDLPGNPMMWLLILSELGIFGAFFVGYGIAYALNPVVFAQSQAMLDPWLGGINTIILVTSGLLAALALAARRGGHSGRAALLATIILGAVFLAVKAVEYAPKVAAGIGPETNTFFALYYLLTGFHALHVVFGIVILGIVAWKNSIANLETGTAFWHMLDMIWVIMYPLLYLLR